MSDFDDALQIIKWGSEQKENSASLTPAQCAALLEVVEEFECAVEDEGLRAVEE